MRIVAFLGISLVLNVNFATYLHNIEGSNSKLVVVTGIFVKHRWNDARVGCDTLLWPHIRKLILPNNPINRFLML